MNTMTHDFGLPHPRGARRLIALEFNELCPHLLDAWMGEGLLPNFSRLHAKSQVFVTEADVADPAQLEPWIQWYSVHTGLAYDQHRVFHLSEGKRGGHADIYRMAIAAGRRAMSFGSMNVAPFAEPGSVFLGDPWSHDDDASPPALNVFNRFVSRSVREYSNPSDRMGGADYARFVAFMARHGLSGDTLAAIAAQLGTEKLRDPRLAYRRVAVLDNLQFDVFASTWRLHRPHFASFFSNAVAHLQHSYWRHMDPGAFTLKPDAADQALYGDAIRFAYVATDRLLGKILRFARRENAQLMFLTALSQQPFLRYEDKGGQHFHRLHDVDRFLARMRIDCADVTPTMTHQYLARFASPAQASAARQRLEALRMEDGRDVFGFPVIETDAASLYFGCQIAMQTDADAIIVDGLANSPLRFGDQFYKIEAIKSGRHHPDGCLWIEHGSHRRHAEKVSILDVLPTQLDLLGMSKPRGAFLGKSLARQVALA